jgi:hypothetical protein
VTKHKSPIFGAIQAGTLFFLSRTLAHVEFHRTPDGLNQSGVCVFEDCSVGPGWTLGRTALTARLVTGRTAKSRRSGAAIIRTAIAFGPRRAKFLHRQFAILVFVQRSQRGGSVGDFHFINDAVAICIQRAHQRRCRRKRWTSSFTFASSRWNRSLRRAGSARVVGPWRWRAETLAGTARRAFASRRVAVLCNGCESCPCEGQRHEQDDGVFHNLSFMFLSRPGIPACPMTGWISRSRAKITAVDLKRT